MLAACTVSSLSLFDAPTLKRTSASVRSESVTAIGSPSTVAWSLDNSCLFLAQAGGIHKYNSSGQHIDIVFPTDSRISSLACRDKDSTVIFSIGSDITVLEIESRKVAQKFNSHKTNVTSLSLSNDATLLASTSTNTVLVHNLSTISHTVLRGLPPGNITTCTFHPHTRTRIFLGINNQLVIYDTSRPSGPARVIPMGKSGSKQIVSVTSSPFSKSLIAVACSGGTIGLIDLDKEKGLFRTLSLRTALTTLAFSPEGASLYAGTGDGKILIVDLRALENSPKAISISQNNESVVCIAVQNKSKPAGNSTTKPSTAKPLAQQDMNKTPIRRASAASSGEKKPSLPARSKTLSTTPPPRNRVISITSTSTPAKVRSTSSAMSTRTPKPPIRTRTISNIGPASPNTRLASTPARPASVVDRAPANRKASQASESAKHDNARVTRPSSSDLLHVSVTADELLGTSKTQKGNVSPKVDIKRPRTTSLTSRSSGVTARQRTVSTTSRTSGSSRTVSGSSTSALSSTTAKTSPYLSKKPSMDPISPIPPVPKLPAAFEEQLTSIRLSQSRSPSPDISVPEDISITLFPRRKKGKAKDSETNGLGLGADEWVKVCEKEIKDSRKVGFAEEPSCPVPSGFSSIPRNDRRMEDAKPNTQEAKIELTVQISPRRPLPQAKTSSTWTAIPSPLRTPHTSDTGEESSGDGHTGSSKNPAHDLLQSLIRDALYDFRRETKAEIIGLHLDLVRMGRSWRKEMKEAMDQWSAELKELRDENQRLREENERLRRGY